MAADIARYRRRHRAVLAAAAVMTLATLVIILISVLGSRNVPAAQHAAAGGNQAAGLVAAPLSSGGVAAPLIGAVRWVSVAGAQVPVSASVGPHNTDGGLATGFTHDAAGAVLAAVHISVRLSPQAGPNVFGPTLQEQVVGAGAAALAAALDEEYAQARTQLGLPYGAPAGQLSSTVAGYQVSMVGPDTAAVRLLIEGPDGNGGSAWVVLTTQMRWTGTDWALQAPANGDVDAAAVLVTDPTGFILFADRS